MNQTVEVPFQVTMGEADLYDEGTEGVQLSALPVDKTFTGDLAGSSRGRMLACGRGDTPMNGAGYVVSERVTGTLAGRVGTFVLQHGGIAGAGVDPVSFGNVVPGSGTGDLAGLTGSCQFAHDERGARLTLTYDFSEGRPPIA